MLHNTIRKSKADDARRQGENTVPEGIKSKLEMIRLLYGEPMSVFASLLRSVIIAQPGKILDCGDYAAIEARVLFWVAKHESGLKAFREGRDLYKELAAEIFNVLASKVDDRQRFVGKQATLGCGYGMGAKKFMATCENFSQTVSEELAKAAITVYRSVHRPVVELWSNIERAAVAAVQNTGKKYTINRTAWHVSDGFLWCTLPSGRRLAYYGPKIQFEATPWDERRPVLYHWGVDSLSKKWVFAKTYGGKLTENVVQAISRDLMAEAMLRIEACGPWQIVLSVHDELVAERDDFGGSNKEFLELMAELPAWAEGCPVKVEGWEGRRYRK